MTGTFEIKDDFYLNNEKIQLISGAIHYFRVVPKYWRDRMEKLKNMGCNAVETYIPWNLHEEVKGRFCFSGILDIRAFLNIAEELGLYAIVRPSPYICAEWEFGGLPAWLLKEDSMRLRCSYEPYLKHIEDYYGELFKVLAPMQINYGGPIIMMQLENEYGYYGDDDRYLNSLKQMMIKNGTVVPLFTSDGPWGDALSCGSLKGILPTGNFGSSASTRFKAMREFTNGPLMCMEFWVGWFDSWGEKKHKVSDLEMSIKDFEEIVSKGNHVNIYMFQGGTNFGFMNGANYYDCLTPDVTSYDYDALLTENGKTTKKYEAFKEIIKKYKKFEEISLSTDIREIAYGMIPVESKASLFEVLDDISVPVSSICPISMEKLGQNYGYILYRSKLRKEKKVEKIRFVGANDRVKIYLDKKHLITLYDRELLQEADTLADNEGSAFLDILVENMGRVNFGAMLEYQRKGINGGVLINGHHHYNWEMYVLPLDNIDKVDFNKGYTEGSPGFYRFYFDADDIGDTFLDFTGWGKGCAFVNGFNIGRFWEAGPQKRLYIPGPLLRKGRNEIILFETEGKHGDGIMLMDEPMLE